MMSSKQRISAVVLVVGVLVFAIVGVIGVRQAQARAQATGELLQAVQGSGAGNSAPIAALLQRGADPNARFGYQNSAFVDRLALWVPVVGGTGAFNNSLAVQRQRPAIVEAARYGATNTVRVLLQAGANPNAADKTGETALREAVKRDDREMAKALLEAGAQSDSRDSATSLFSLSTSPQMTELLRGHRAR